MTSRRLLHLCSSYLLAVVPFFPAMLLFPALKSCPTFSRRNFFSFSLKLSHIHGDVETLLYHYQYSHIPVIYGSPAGLTPSRSLSFSLRDSPIDPCSWSFGRVSVNKVISLSSARPPTPLDPARQLCLP